MSERHVCTSPESECPYHASGGPKTIACGPEVYTGFGAKRIDPLLIALRSASPEEARAVYDALSSWVENEECNDQKAVDEEDRPIVVHGRALLGRLDAAMASIAE